MYFFLILFFASLIGIVFMIGRKLMLLDTSSTIQVEEVVIEAIDLNHVKHKTVKHAKRYGFIILVTTLRFTIKTSYLVKRGYKRIKIKTVEFINQISNKGKAAKEREVSSFLKKVSDYKEIINEIKDQIKEEEGIK